MPERQPSSGPALRPAKTTVLRRRPPVQQERILAALRRHIRSGTLLPGSRVPSQADLVAEFKVSKVTAQRAIRRLADDGLVVTGRRGTCVAPHPPHLCRYGLVVPVDSPTASRNNFLMALSREAERLLPAGSGREFRQYFIDERLTGATSHALRQLVHDVENGCLRGLIFATAPHYLKGTPVLSAKGVPRVALASAAAPGVKIVRVDTQPFVTRAAAYLASRGRRRVAVLLYENIVPADIDFCMGELRRQRLETAPYWVHGVALGTPRWAQNCTHLMFRAGQTERPDALIIWDDNLVEGATAGLVDAGVRVPEDVEVVAHCNFPWPTPSAVPAKRLGFDVREVLRACLARLEAPGQDPPDAARVSIKFDDEIAESRGGRSAVPARAAKTQKDRP